MRISNSSLKTFWTCPTMFQTIYIEGLQKPASSYLQFGSRVHDLLQAYYIGMSPVGVGYNPDPPPTLDPMLEAEAHAMMAAYRAHYPQEPFEVLETEKNFEIKLPGTEHILQGRCDMLVRDKLSGQLQIFETKTESRGSKRNLPQSWVIRSQASLYIWAAQQIFQKPIDTVILNVCTRKSDKGQVGPGFRRDNLHRSPQQISSAIKDAIWIADSLEKMQETQHFPRNTDSCCNERGYNCDFYSRCHMGSDEGLVSITPYSYLGI